MDLWCFYNRKEKWGIRLGKCLRFYGKCGLPRVNVAYFFVNDNVDGIYYGIDDWGFGLWRRVWISGKRVGICLRMRLWKSEGMDLGGWILGLRDGFGGLEMWIFGWNVRLEGTFGSALAEETVDLEYGMGGLRAGFWEFMCGFGEIFSVVLALILQSVSK